MTRPTIRVVAVDALREEIDHRRDSASSATTRCQTTFDLPDEPWDAVGFVCVGAVAASTADDVRRAALRGAELVLAFPNESWVAPLVRDLARVGDVVVGARPAGDPVEQLVDDQRELLELLASGATIPEAAAALFLSTRTAERRLGAARRLLGVRTTAEAVLLAGARR